MNRNSLFRPAGIGDKPRFPIVKKAPWSYAEPTAWAGELFWGGPNGSALCFDRHFHGKRHAAVFAHGKADNSARRNGTAFLLQLRKLSSVTGKDTLPQENFSPDGKNVPQKKN